MVRHSIRLLVIAVLLAAVPVVPAAAHHFEAETRGVIDDGGPSGANGHITSNVGACLRHRKVKLLRQQKGPDKSYGTDFTNRSGKWDIDSSLLAGMYYIKVREKYVGDVTSEHEHHCLSGVSIKYNF